MLGDSHVVEHLFLGDAAHVAELAGKHEVVVGPVYLFFVQETQTWVNNI